MLSVAAEQDVVERLRRSLASLPRVPLARLPTPLDMAPRLSQSLGGPAIAVKRDDLTGLALGGNKTRQLEFLLGDALQQGATAVITGAGLQSNHCRQLAAACALLGLRACLVLRGERPAQLEGNLLLDELFGAEARFIPVDRFYDEFARVASAWSEEFAARGERACLVDTLGWDSPSLGIAALGYVDAAIELVEQFRAQEWWPDAVYVCSGAATQAGLLLGFRALDLPCRLVGVSASPFIPDKPSVIAAVANRAARLLGLDMVFGPQDVVNLDDYVGPGYGASTPASVEALRLAARTEGLLLDPTYTAKGFAALVDHVRRGLVGPGERILFLHTGGAPALFLTQNANLMDRQGESWTA